MTWTNLSIPAIPAITQAGSVISQSLNIVKSGLELIKTEAQVLQAFPQNVDTAEQAFNQGIQLLLNSITGILNSLLDDAGLYCLLIPLPKKGLVRLIPNNATTQTPVNNLLNGASSATANTIRNSLTYAQIFNPDEMFIGGNAHVVKTIIDSLFDSGDINRPKFTNTCYWGYGLFVAGATDITSVMSSATFLDNLFHFSNGANTVSATRGMTSFIPRNVRIRPSARTAFPVLEWDQVPGSQLFASFDSATLIATKVAIIRSTDFRVKTARKVSDLFDSANLDVGKTGLYGARVIAAYDYDGILSQYNDTSTLDADKTYYYHVCFKGRLVPQFDPGNSVQEVDCPFDDLSACVEYRTPSNTQRTTSSTLSKAPDWFRSPSLVSLIPALNPIVAQLQEYIRAIGSTVQSTTARNSEYIAFLDRQISFYEGKITQIENHLTQLQNIFNTGNAAIAATVRTGQGKVVDFLADVMTAMDDTSDEHRPSFDNGNEYTTGVILLAVGPNPQDIVNAVNLLNSLFNSQTPDTPTQHVLDGINSITTQVAAVEQNLLTQLTNGINLSPSLTFNQNMTPRPAGQGDFACDPST